MKKQYIKTPNPRTRTTLEINESVVGESIEIMLERLKEGEGEDSVEDRDLVYNSDETETVNPLTNIRSDKMELMLEEKIGEYEWRGRKTRSVEEKNNEEGGDDIEVEVTID